MPCAINTFNICVDVMYTIHIVLEFRLNCAKCNKNIILGFADLIEIIQKQNETNHDLFEMHLYILYQQNISKEVGGELREVV